MAKQIHEIRDPIHVFIRMSSDERRVVNSRAFQRLRHIHQLGLTYLVYPGATHRRFEHSLGVMELAGRIFDVVTKPENLNADVRDVLPEVDNDEMRPYWRRVLRVAALLHDIGHLPFSHAAEKELLPHGTTHEDLTRNIILNSELGQILSDSLKLRPLNVVKLALGPRKARDLVFTTGEAILAEIIVGDAFGADRMDYLLRDSYHAGVAYGRFDHYRLIDTLRILPAAPLGSSDGAPEPALGILDGGIHSAEAMALARFFMFTQLYFHQVRRIYDIHLRDFLLQTLPGHKYTDTVSEHLQWTDNEVTAAILKAARDPTAAGHDPARRIAKREHFKLLYQRHPDDVKMGGGKINVEPGRAVYDAARAEFGRENVRWDCEPAKGGTPEFPVLPKDGPVASSTTISEPLAHVPAPSFDFVFVEPELHTKARQWLQQKRQEIIESKEATQ